MLQDILNQPFKANNLDNLLDSKLPKQKLPTKKAHEMFLKGVKALKKEDLVTASDMFSKIMRIKPDHLPTIEAMGMTSHKLENHEVAINFFKALNEMAPAYVPGYVKLGTIYALQGMADEAVAILKKGLIIAPENQDCLHALAYVYAASGQKDKAQKTYKKLLALEPEHPSALYSFSRNFYKYKDLKDNPYFNLLKKYNKNFDKYNTRMKQEIMATFAKAHEDTKDYDTAFSYFKKAAKIKKEDLNFTPGQLNKGLTLMEEYFDKDFFSSLSENSAERHGAKEPVFICGFPRSWTTLLEQIMHSHPDMFGIGESEFFLSLCKSNRIFLNRNGKVFPVAYTKSILNTPVLDYASAGQKYIDYLHTYKKGLKRYVNKAISNIAHAGAIYTLFPNAKFIHIRRNPLDSCLSAYMQQFNEDVQPYTYDLKHLGFFYQRYEELMGHWKSLFPENIMTLTYEELVNDTEGKAKEVINFVDLPWDDRCLQFHQVNKFVKTASVSQVRKPVYKTAQNKWKRYEKHLAPLVKALGDLAPEDSLYLLDKEDKKAEKTA